MKVKFFISPPSETSWHIDAREFQRRLLEQWPETELRPTTDLPPGTGYSLEWTTPLAGRDVEGSLDITGRVVVLYADIADCAKFAVWFRRLVAGEQELLCYDEDYNVDVALDEDTTEADIVKAFSG